MANSENVKIWVNALRSGQYSQGTARLKLVESGQTRHCCLGVACELAIQNGVELSVEQTQAPSGIEVTLFDNQFSYLPEKVIDWLGLRSENPVVWDGEYQFELVDLNDSGRTFLEIANLIESNWVEDES